MQRRMRFLRQKHNITIYDLAPHSEVSAQRLSQIELGDARATEHMSRLVEMTFHRYIRRRQEELARLEADFAKYRGRLLEEIDERSERT